MTDTRQGNWVTRVTGGSHARAREAAMVQLERLADEVRRLVPHHRDPERFHIEKRNIERQLRRLADEARHG